VVEWRSAKLVDGQAASEFPGTVPLHLKAAG